MNLAYIEVLKTVVFVSILFVWVVRYSNIIEEFKTYRYPVWLRDIVGIFKISFAVMLMSQNPQMIKVGSMGIALLMVCALLTHVKIRNPLHKMLPSFLLLCSSIFIFTQT